MTDDHEKTLKAIASRAAKKFLEGTGYETVEKLVQSGKKSVTDWCDCLRQEHDLSREPTWVYETIEVIRNAQAVTTSELAQLLFVSRAESEKRLNHLLNIKMVCTNTGRSNKARLFSLNGQ